jgi:hypothetical protein
LTFWLAFAFGVASGVLLSALTLMAIGKFSTGPYVPGPFDRSDYR